MLMLALYEKSFHHLLTRLYLIALDVILKHYFTLDRFAWHENPLNLRPSAIIDCLKR